MLKKDMMENLLLSINNLMKLKILKNSGRRIRFPCFIKASRSGSSVGCYRCDHKEDLMTKLIEASKYDRHIVVEECVDCIELETAVLGNDDQSFQSCWTNHASW